MYYYQICWTALIHSWEVWLQPIITVCPQCVHSVTDVLVSNRLITAFGWIDYTLPWLRYWTLVQIFCLESIDENVQDLYIAISCNSSTQGSGCCQLMHIFINPDCPSHFCNTSAEGGGGPGGHSDDKRGNQTRPYGLTKSTVNTYFPGLNFAPLCKYSSGIWHPEQACFYFFNL